MTWVPLLGLLPFVLSMVLMLALVLGYRALRRRRARRSPLAARQIGHVPGQQLVERINDHQSEMLSAVTLMYVALPLMFASWAGMQIDWNTIRWGFAEWAFLAGGAGLFAYGMRSYAKHLHAREQAQDGLLAERVTGMQLNRLISRDCTVMHDLPAENFNIDHVVISPRGVYAVETKSFRKPKRADRDHNDARHRVQFDGTALHFPDFKTSAPLNQARQQAQWLHRYLREALDRDVPVTPAVALPGWFVVQEEEVWRSAPVKVFSPMREGASFMAVELQRLDAETRALIATALAQRFPIAPE